MRDKDGVRDEEGTNRPAQAINFPQGDTPAQVFGDWWVSTVARTSPGERMESVTAHPCYY